MEKEKIFNIVITGAAGNIAYSLIPLLGAGNIFGQDCKLIINLHDLQSQIQSLQGLKMELEDCSFPLIKQLNYGSDFKEMAKEADIAIFLGSQARRPGMDRVDFLAANGQIFLEQGKILNEIANPNCKILVVASPVYINTLILQQFCKSIPKENFTALTILELNRAKYQLSKLLNCDVNKIENLSIWGSNYSQMIPDPSNCLINDVKVQDYMKQNEIQNLDDLTQMFQKRGSDVLQAYNTIKKSSIISAVYAIRDHLKYLYHGNQDNQWTSMGVISDGSYYGIPQGYCLTVPVRCKGQFKFEVVKDLQLDQSILDLNLKIVNTQDEEYKQIINNVITTKMENEQNNKIKEKTINKA